MTQFHGVIPPIVTPFTADEEIDEQALRAEVEYQMGAGVNGLCVTGTTGEGNALNAIDSAEVARITVDQVGGRVPVLAGIIRNSTRESAEFGRRLADTGVAGLQVTPVHYLWKPGPDATIEHYRAIADATDLPLVIYNVVPWSMVETETLVRLVTEEPRVVGVKQSGGDLHKVADLMWHVGDKITVLSAVDDLLYPAFSLGVHGTISGTSSLAPGLVVQLWNAVQAGDHATARDLHAKLLPLWRAVEASNMPALVKECLRQQGREVGVPRRPVDTPTTEQVAAITRALDFAGLRPGAD